MRLRRRSIVTAVLGVVLAGAPAAHAAELNGSITLEASASGLRQ